MHGERWTPIRPTRLVLLLPWISTSTIDPAVKPVVVAVATLPIRRTAGPAATTAGVVEVPTAVETAGTTVTVKVAGAAVTASSKVGGRANSSTHSEARTAVLVESLPTAVRGSTETCLLPLVRGSTDTTLRLPLTARKEAGVSPLHLLTSSMAAEGTRAVLPVDGDRHYEENVTTLVHIS